MGFPQIGACRKQAEPGGGKNSGLNLRMRLCEGWAGEGGGGPPGAAPGVLGCLPFQGMLTVTIKQARVVHITHV